MPADSLREQLTRLLSQTREGRIEWKKNSATTAIWVKKMENRTVSTSLQKMVAKTQLRRQEAYVLVIRQSPSELLLSVNSAQQPAYFDVLRELYAAIEEKQDDKGATIIDDLLKD